MKIFTFLLSLLFIVASVQAQDYRISFAGIGESNQVGTVTVKNLNYGQSLTLNGTDVLHLVGPITGIKPVSENERELNIYPNPSNGTSTIKFFASNSGKVTTELFDISGKRVGTAKNIINKGIQVYQISNLQYGIYTVRITSQSYNYTAKLVSSGTPNSDVKINYIGNETIPLTSMKLKSANAEKEMDYRAGNRLKITGTSGIYTTIITDVPTQNKVITFTFTACTDADDNNYPIVQIGTQIWMVENLKTTKYNDGTSIPNVTGNTAWANLTTHTPGYCWYNNDISYKNPYGALYNWYSVNTGKLAPVGWHIPTDAEWTTLTTFLGGNSVAGDKLKEIGYTHWKVSNGNATDEAGFAAIPAGYRNYLDGKFVFVGSNGSWWTSSEGDSNYAAWLRYVHDGRWVYNPYSYKEHGFSVRCVRD